MANNLYLLKKDARDFFKRNSLKLIIFYLIVIISAVLAVRSVLSMPSVADFFENKNSSLFSFLKGEGSMLTLAFVSIIEIAFLLLLLYLCAYNDLTTLLIFVVIGVKAYLSFKKLFVVLLYFGVKAVPFFALYLIALFALLTCLIVHAIKIINSHLRLRYGISELKCLIAKFTYFYLVYLIALFITLIFIGVGAIFI